MRDQKLIQKVKGYLEELYDEYERNGYIEYINDTVRRHRLNSNFNSILKKGGLITRVIDDRATSDRPYKWNTIQPNNAMVLKCVDGYRAQNRRHYKISQERREKKHAEWKAKEALRTELDTIQDNIAKENTGDQNAGMPMLLPGTPPVKKKSENQGRRPRGEKIDFNVDTFLKEDEFKAKNSLLEVLAKKNKSDEPDEPSEQYLIKEVKLFGITIFKTQITTNWK